jgi:hypothetical protein
MSERPFYWVPRFKRGALGWTYVRWGRKLWRIW